MFLAILPIPPQIGTPTRIRGSHAIGYHVASPPNDIPVIPIALCGTRALLRDGSFLLRHGAVEVKMGNPISPPRGADFDAAIELLKASRRWILQNCGESDLLK